MIRWEPVYSMWEAVWVAFYWRVFLRLKIHLAQCADRSMAPNCIQREREGEEWGGWHTLLYFLFCFVFVALLLCFLWCSWFKFSLETKVRKKKSRRHRAKSGNGWKCEKHPNDRADIRPFFASSPASLPPPLRIGIYTDFVIQFRTTQFEYSV